MELKIHRLQDVLDTMPVYAILVTENYKVIYANKYFKDTFGCNDDHLPCYKYLWGRETPCETCKTFIPLKTGEPVVYDWVGPNGRDYEVYDYPFIDEDGTKLIMEMGIDVTDNRKMERKLRAMTSEIILAEENQRKIFATNLHDTVVQTLGVIKLRLQMADHTDVDQTHRENYEEICRLTAQAIQESRQLMQDMSPQVLYELGFAQAIEWLIDNAQKRDSNLAVELITRNSTVFDKLARDVQILLFQSIRELLNNILKHAHAKRATITILGNKKKVRIQVKDYGTGFGEHGERRVEGGGFGLMNIKERLKYMEGQITINTGKKGTTVDIEVPIR